MKHVLICVVCDEKYHGSCVGMTVPVVAALLKIVSSTGWVCQSCRSVAKKHMEKLLVGQSCLSLEVAQLKSDFLKLQQIVESSHQLVLNKCDEVASIRPQQVDGNLLEWPQLQLQSTVAAETGMNVNISSAENVMLAKVHTELNDKQRRVRNVVVRGLEQVDGVDDLSVFVNFCERNLPIKPAIDRCRRVGKTLPGKVQPLLVVLKNENAVTEILNCAPQLRKSTDEAAKSVFINRDLTAAQALAAYQLRAARRSQKQQTTTTTVEQSRLHNGSSTGIISTDRELSVNAANSVAQIDVQYDSELSSNATVFVPTTNDVCVAPCV
jgi:hypothetical protein